jgi:alkylation response protein AidB-like acyl-CoA dehydrogenase
MIRDKQILDQFLASIEKFVRERLVPAENEVTENDAVPDDIVQDMGLFGMTIPESMVAWALPWKKKSMWQLNRAERHPLFVHLLVITMVSAPPLLYLTAQKSKNKPICLNTPQANLSARFV